MMNVHSIGAAQKPQERETTEIALAGRQDELLSRLGEGVLTLEDCLGQMVRMLGAMQRRLDEMEARETQITIPHAEVVRLQGRIRARSREICEKYELTDAESGKAFRNAMQKEMLKKYSIRNLHDLPAAQLPAAERWIDGWSSMRLVMERRTKAAADAEKRGMAE